jgi:PAS domain S-box-containing protein
MNAKVALDGRLLMVNQIGEQASGLAHDELMESRFAEGPWWSFDPAVQERVRQAFARAVAGEAVRCDEQLFVFGKEITIDLNLSPVRDETGEVAYVVAEGRDISAQKEAEASLRRYAAELSVANRELDAFAYAVSHDLRAPLRSIDGFSSALLEDCTDRLDEAGHGHLNRIRAAAGRMAALIDDLLGLSRVTRAPLQRERVDLTTLAWGIIAGLTAGDPSRAVGWSITPDLVADADPRLMRVALENLLGNAWKYTRRRPSAHIALGQRNGPDGFAYYVRDDGAGFEPAYAGKLFAPFQRLHAASEYEGTGIGLATVARIIHRHGGRVWAEGEVDQGATFYFTL